MRNTKEDITHRRLGVSQQADNQTNRQTVMANDDLEALQASCPKEGSFYVCEDKPVRFVGCCTVDPCKTETGVCPDASLRATSFSTYSYNQLLPQECVSKAPEVQWFTCAAIDVPFMGCCASNPCSDGCPRADLSAARLSDDDTEAALFLPEDHDSNDDDGGELSTGAIAGIAVGAVAVGLIVAGLTWWFMRRRRQQEASRKYEPFTSQQIQADLNSPAPTGPSYGNKHSSGAIISPYASTFASASPDPQQQYHHPQHYNQHLHQQEHQNQLSWDGSQTAPAYQSPPLQQGTFSPSPYTSGNDVAGYAPALEMALNSGHQDYSHQRQAPVPVQELPGGVAQVSELSSSQDHAEYDLRNHSAIERP